MAQPKITLVGASSLIFSMSTINDISLTEDLRDCELALIDINTEGLELVEHLAGRLAGMRGSGMRVTATLDLAAALDGADFVINAAAIGERDLWPAERELARHHGYWPSKGFRISGLRNTPLALEIAQSMETHCPDAWLLQHSNPMAANVGAVSRHTRVKVAGFCHGVPGTVRDLSRWMGVDPSRLDVEAVGINHFLFITKWYLDGQDGYEGLLKWNEQEFPAVWETDEWIERTDVPGPVSQDLCRRFGVFPCNGDEHLSDYFAWYTNTPEARQKFRAKTDYLDRYLQRGRQRWTTWAELAQGSTEDLQRAFAKPSGEVAAAVLNALWVPGKSHLLHAIVPNRGSIGGLPEDSAVEMPVVVTTDDIRPVGTHHLPLAAEAHIGRRLAEEELEMDAALEQRRDLVYRALELDPYTTSIDQVRAYVDGLADINQEYLPWLK